MIDGQRQQREVARAGAQLLQARSELPDITLTSTSGCCRFSSAMSVREDIQTDRHPAEQADRAAQRFLAVGDAGDGVLQILEHPVTELEQRLARRRNPDASADAQEDGLLQLVLEQQDLAADRRLGHVQLVAGGGEGACLGDGANDLELAKVHEYAPCAMSLYVRERWIQDQSRANEMDA